MPKPIHKPGAVVNIRTGDVTANADGSTSFEQFDYGVPEIKRDRKWEPHPAWLGDYTQPTEFDIELISNVLDYSFQSHLACYVSLKPFCMRAHRGPDGVGVAQRRTESGGLCMVECDPDRCDLYQQYVNKGREDILKEKYAGKIYKYAKLFGKKGKTVPQCRPQNFLIFNLFTPDGKLAHPDGHYAMISTHSNVTADRFREMLRNLFVRTNGRLAGLRLRLIFDPFQSGHKKSPTPAWNLEIPEGTDFDTLSREAAIRRQIPDWEKIITDEQCTALVKANEGINLKTQLAAIDPAYLMDQEEAATRVHVEDVSASYIDPATVFLINQHPTVRLLTSRIGTSYPNQVRFPMDYGDNVYACIKMLVEYAREQNIPVSDIVAASEFAAAFGGSDDGNDGVKHLHGSDSDNHDASNGMDGSAPIEAEFTEVEERDADEIAAAVRGGVKAGKPEPEFVAPTEDEIDNYLGKLDKGSGHHETSKDEPKLFKE